MTVLILYCLLTFFLLLVYDYIPKGVLRKIHWSVYTFVEYVSLSLILYYSIINRNFKALVVVLSIAFISFQIVYFLTQTLPSRHANLDSVAIGIETILIFVYSFYYLYQEFKDPKNPLIIKNPMFWIVCGTIFYLGGSFFFNILATHLSTVELARYWYYSYLFDIIKNILFAIAVVFFARQSSRGAKEKIPYLDIDQLDMDRIVKHN